MTEHTCAESVVVDKTAGSSEDCDASMPMQSNRSVDLEARRKSRYVAALKKGYIKSPRAHTVTRFGLDDLVDSLGIVPHVCRGKMAYDYRRKVAMGAIKRPSKERCEYYGITQLVADMKLQYHTPLTEDEVLNRRRARAYLRHLRTRLKTASLELLRRYGLEEAAQQFGVPIRD